MFGYSLFESNGDLIWCDSNSEKFFEIEDRKQRFNIFSKIIPLSKSHLAQKL